MNVSAAVEPEDVFDYVYGVLHSPAYRATYETFLKNDFPRVPVPRDNNEWDMVIGFGRRLRELHLMDTSAAMRSPRPMPLSAATL